MKKQILLTLFVAFTTSFFSQNEIKEKTDTIIVKETIEKVDTAYIHKTTYKIDYIQKNINSMIYDTIYKTIELSEYNQLFEKTLDQKQKHYDNALENLQLYIAFFGFLFTIIFAGLGYLGYGSLSSLKKKVNEDLEVKFDQEKSLLEQKFNRQARQLQNSHKMQTESYNKQVLELKAAYNLEIDRYKNELMQLDKDRHDADVNELKDKIMNLERFANDSTGAFIVKHGKSDPKLFEEEKPYEKSKDPFKK